MKKKEKLATHRVLELNDGVQRGDTINMHRCKRTTL